ncbi:MAG: flavodoxin family protein [Gaiellaceae bacterium]
MSSNDVRKANPRVLLVYYSHTNQAKRVSDAMAEVLRGRDCDVTQARIEFTDPHYAKNFKVFPFRHAVFGILPLLWPQLRRKTGQIRIPDEAKVGDYDLVCFGSPTWFFTTNMPLRSYLKSDQAHAVLAGKPFAAYVVCRRYWSINLKEVRKRGTAQGGEYVDGIRFTYEGGQIRSLLALLSYFGKGEMRERSLGIKIPPTNLKPDFGDQAEAFANKLADTLEPSAQIAQARSSPEHVP